MLKILNSQWVNTVFLLRTVINLYSLEVKIRKGFIHEFCDLVLRHFQSKHAWNEEFFHRLFTCPLPTCFPINKASVLTGSFINAITALFFCTKVTNMGGDPLIFFAITVTDLISILQENKD